VNHVRFMDGTAAVSADERIPGESQPLGASEKADPLDVRSEKRESEELLWGRGRIRAGDPDAPAMLRNTGCSDDLTGRRCFFGALA